MIIRGLNRVLLHDPSRHTKFGAALLYVADKQLEPGWLKVLERTQEETFKIHKDNDEKFKHRLENGGPSQEEEPQTKYEASLVREDAIKTVIDD